MKRITVLCVLSAVAGSALTAVSTYGPDPLPTSIAQEPEPVRPPVVRGTEARTAPGPIDEGPSAAGQAPLQPGQPPAAASFQVAPPRDPALDMPPGLTHEEYVNIAVYENCNRSVVNISTKGLQGDRFLWIEIPSKGEGSGVVIDQKGHVLTNYHVVEGAQEIQVTLSNGKSYDARLVGHDSTNDVAVLHVDAPPDELVPVSFGDSSNLKVGQRVFAIGNPFGLERTLTTGIISSLNRWLPSRANNRKIKQIIQIDAAINPGSSGGPLLDSRARMIGMNTAIASRTGESAGVGFAIPVNTIARVVPELIRNGRVTRPEIGIGLTARTEHGLLIATLTSNGPAERAGLRGFRLIRKRQGLLIFETVDRSTADLIVALDGQPIRTRDDFDSIIEGKRPGDVVTVTVIRGGQQVPIRVQLEGGSE